MAMGEPNPARMTYAEYLLAEQSSETKHEYLRGEVYAMAGGTPTHAGLAMAVGVALSNALAERPCRVFSSDLRVRVEATDLSTYPDLTVVCGRFEGSATDPDAAINPVLIVEILSDSTEAYDRGEKFAHYRRIPSLREYVLVSQHRPRLEAYAQNDEGAWVLAEATAGETLELRSLPGVQLQTDAIYRDPLAPH